MQKADLYNEIKDILSTQVQCVLATVDDLQPCLHLMAYGFSEDLSEIYLASYADTRKVRNMLIQREVALLWDNRTSNHQDHVDGFALNASGKATMLEGELYKSVSQLLLDRNPTLEALLSNDKTAVFSVDVSSYVFAKGYTSVYEFQPV
ncbi:MAG: pyridoxamine 5'-phosphate oxidase family protein [Pseudomonadales bacterium]